MLRLPIAVVAGVAATFSTMMCSTCAFSVMPTTTTPTRTPQSLGVVSPCHRRCSVLFATSSRIEGNQREPSAQELLIMDEMIDKLLLAKPYELPTAVQRAFRVVSSPPFFLRIAHQADLQQDNDKKEQLLALASNVLATIEAVRSTATEKLQDISMAIETVVAAAAEPDSGEFLVPLTPERIRAMQEALEKTDEELWQQEAFLTTLDAWMNKAHEDGMDGMVGILQKVLQMVSGRRVLQATTPSDLFKDLLLADVDSWDSLLQKWKSQNGDTSGLITEIQRYLETIVLSLDSGSMNQRVQAEYLKEMLTRAETYK